MNISSPPTTFHYRHYKITTTRAVQQPSPPSPPPPEPLTETETPVRFGILGCAGVARKVSRGIKLAPNASLYAVGSRSHDKAVQFAAANDFPPEAKIYGSYNGLLDDPDVDAIYAPLPTGLHVEWAVHAAQKKKHVMLEKPAAMSVSDLDIILEACEANGVQLMDGTMFVHHPRTAKMKEFLNDPERFGQLQSVNSIFTFRADPYYIEHNIRTKPELDGLGALGDVGWYCIRAILWATDYELPKSVIALHGAILNKAGVIMSCRASLHWEDGRVATFHCSFLENLTMDVTAIGSRGTLRLDDFNIPLEETKASFSTTTDTRYNDLATEWVSRPSQQTVFNDLPQESLQVIEFSRLVQNIKSNGAKPEKWWSMVSRKTQVVTDAVVKSINNGFQVVELT